MPNPSKYLVLQVLFFQYSAQCLHNFAKCAIKDKFTVFLQKKLSFEILKYMKWLVGTGTYQRKEIVNTPRKYKLNNKFFIMPFDCHSIVLRFLHTEPITASSTRHHNSDLPSRSQLRGYTPSPSITFLPFCLSVITPAARVAISPCNFNFFVSKSILSNAAPYNTCTFSGFKVNIWFVGFALAWTFIATLKQNNFWQNLNGPEHEIRQVFYANQACMGRKLKEYKGYTPKK